MLVHTGLHPGAPQPPRVSDPIRGSGDSSAKSVQLTNSWTWLLPLCQREGRERRKRRLEEHISKVQRPSDIAQNHIAFEHEGAESETHGIHSLPRHIRFEKSRQTRALEGHRGNQSGVPEAVLGKESRAGEGVVFFSSSPSDQ